MTNTRQIIPFGGMRRTERRVHPLIDYLLVATGKSRVRVCIIATATGDSAQHYEGWFPPERTWITHLRLFDRTVTDLPDFLCDQDLIFVGGGNTLSMLAVWRAHGVDVALRAAWEAGVVLTGGSAGSLAWFDCGTTDSFHHDRLEPLHDGLGFLSGSHCPHYDGEAQRRPLYQKLIGDGFPAGIAIDEDAAVHYEGTEIREIVSARTGATAYRVERNTDGQVLETALSARSLAPAEVGVAS
ncbi:MAG TPA: peptidase E [Candidatus Latescibacteria bacterium]|jgi:peptidase E|nr:peptidase E [Candidatus Latescibacterota bacterium]